jgi:hypothetical protein
MKEEETLTEKRIMGKWSELLKDAFKRQEPNLILGGILRGKLIGFCFDVLSLVTKNSRTCLLAADIMDRYSMIKPIEFLWCPYVYATASMELAMEIREDGSRKNRVQMVEYAHMLSPAYIHVPDGVNIAKQHIKEAIKEIDRGNLADCIHYIRSEVLKDRRNKWTQGMSDLSNRLLRHMTESQEFRKFNLMTNAACVILVAVFVFDIPLIELDELHSLCNMKDAIECIKLINAYIESIKYPSPYHRKTVPIEEESSTDESNNDSSGSDNDGSDMEEPEIRSPDQSPDLETPRDVSKEGEESLLCNPVWWLSKEEYEDPLAMIQSNQPSPPIPCLWSSPSTNKREREPFEEEGGEYDNDDKEVVHVDIGMDYHQMLLPLPLPPHKKQRIEEEEKEQEEQQDLLFPIDEYILFTD